MPPKKGKDKGKGGGKGDGGKGGGKGEGGKGGGKGGGGKGGGKGEGRQPADDKVRANPQLHGQSSERHGAATKVQQRQTTERDQGVTGYATAASSTKSEEAVYKLPRKDSGDRPVHQVEQPSLAGKDKGRGGKVRGGGDGRRPADDEVRANPQLHEQSFERPGAAAKGQQRQTTGISRVMETPAEVSDESNIITSEECSEEGSGEDIVAKIAGMTIQHKTHKPKYTMAARPGRGNLGRKIALIVNYFALKFKNISVYHYDVDICEVDKFKKPGRSLMTEGMTAKEAIAKKVKHVDHQQRRSIGKKKCREIISNMLLKPEFRGYSPVYDGQKNMYTSKPLPIKSKNEYIVDMIIEGRQKTYCVILKPVNKEGGTNMISFAPLQEMYAGRSSEVPEDVLMALDTIMAHRTPPLTQVQVRSSYFPYDQAFKRDLGSGLEVWFGYNQSVHFTERGPVVVINLAAKAFHKAGSVIDYACDILECDITKVPKLQNYQIKKLEEALSKVKVEVTHQPHRRKYNIKGVSKLSAKDIIQEIDNRKVSVADYFAQKYRRLKYPLLPCLVMRTNNTTYIPFEVCEIYAGQPKVGKLEPALTANMIKGTAIPPDQRFSSIAQDAKTVSKIGEEAMKGFGLFMELSFQVVNGRVMTSPSLSYEGQGKIPPIKPDMRGVWNMDGKRFFRPIIINKWILISFAQYPRQKLEELARILSGSAAKLGMKLGQHEIAIFTNQDETRAALEFAKVKCKADMAVVVVSRRDVHRYEEVKFVADFRLNLVTQCIEDKTVYKIINARNDQVPNNICLKINLKKGGVNHVLNQKPQVFREPCIILGADAIHWARGFGYPSIAAVVGSLDPYPSSYALTCRVQENLDDKKISQEIIRDMKNMVEEVLLMFKEKTKHIPTRIICFRDGVSDGQFKAALEKEVSSIQQASMSAFNKDLPIRLTYIIVQKNHQTRFRPQNPKDGVGKPGNIPPGTVVDTDVVHPVFYDYFLCSHEGIQGTSKPPRYTVIHDDNYLKPDELQELTYHLCHMYGRCNRSVSMPAPVFYADLACARAKTYADLFISDDDSSSSSSGAPQKKLPDHVMSAINSMKSFENNLFYM